MAAPNFLEFLQSEVLTPAQLFAQGYPPRLERNHQPEVYNHHHNEIFPQNSSVLNAHAPEFVPGIQGFNKANSYGESSVPSDPSAYSVASSTDVERREAVERICIRCYRGFWITRLRYLTQERCIYHWGKLQPDQRGFMLYSCCKRGQGVNGCTTSNLHVWNGLKVGINIPYHGFVSTIETTNVLPHYGVYAINCQLSYTIVGLELTKVTVVDLAGTLVYERFVKPKHKIVDYNTRFSGVTENDFSSPTVKTLEQVQTELRHFVNAKTILIGHGLDNSLKALKIVHHTVVDTVCAFPHFKGIPFRYSLKELAGCYLKKDYISGSREPNSYEDAVSCIQLLFYKYQCKFFK